MERRFRLACAGAAALIVIEQVAQRVVHVGPIVRSEIVPGIAASAATAACFLAARRHGGRARRGWTWFAAASGCWALADVVEIVYRVAGYRGAPTPSIVDVPATAALIFATLAVLAFLGRGRSGAGRLRMLLDGLIASTSLLFVGWTGGLGVAYRMGQGGPARVVALAYPLGDLVIASLLIIATTRVKPGHRLPWSLLAGGLTMILVGDSAFAYLQLRALVGAGHVNELTWTAGCLLIALGALAPGSDSTPLSSEPRPGRAFAILLPYAPFLIAGAEAVSLQLRGEPFDTFGIWTLAVLVALLLARQALAQFENLDLTRHLDNLVHDRTEELRRQQSQFRSLVQNATDVLTVVDDDLIVRYQSPAVERVLGFRPSQLVSHPLATVVHPDDWADLAALVAEAPVPPAVPATIEARIRREDGTYAVTETAVANLVDDEGVRGILLTTRDVGDRRQLEDELRHRALHDELTGLGNRTLFYDRLTHAAARYSRKPQNLAVLALDLDGFKNVNDTLGHAAGDTLLKEVAARIGSSIRPGDTVARMGGDEFAILIEGTDYGTPEVVAQRILARLRAPVTIENKSIVPLASIGVAVGRTSQFSSDQLVRGADLALYSAKSHGKGRYEVFEASMQAAALKRAELESDLRRAISNDELVLHYQPIVEIPSGRISGVEALVRWNHPRRGMVPPSQFIPLAEDSDLIVNIGRWVLNRACQDTVRWNRRFAAEKRPPVTMSVNLAGRQLISEWVLKEVTEAVTSSGINPRNLILEITEGSLMKDPSAVQPTLRALKDLGVQLAIDDFGTGWSSLARLRAFPVDKLKVDRAFVSEITSATDEAPLVAAIISMGHSLGLNLVAEGVETVDQLACLHALGCEEVQGYLLARPMPAEQLEALLDDPQGLLSDSGASSASQPFGRSPEQNELMGVVASATRLLGPNPVLTENIMAELQRVTGIDAVVLNRIDRARGLVTIEATAPSSGLVSPGLTMRWAGSPDERMVNGGPRCTPNLAADYPSHEFVRLGAASYVSVPITAADGEVWGTLGALSAEPLRVEQSTIVLLELFAGLVADHVTGADGRTEVAPEPVAQVFCEMSPPSTGMMAPVM